jgi:hypothetical protein
MDRKYYNKKPTREEWHTAYQEELIELYGIFLEHLKPKFDVDHARAFHHFSRMVYADSSGFISDYTKAKCSLNEEQV